VGVKERLILEYVEDYELFHIRDIKYGRMKIGQVYEFGHSINGFYGIYDTSPELPLCDDLNHLKNVATYYWKFLRETVIEEVRLDNFSNYPSRQTCLFVTDDKHVNDWIQHLKYANIEIYKMKLSGKLHKCDATLIDIHPNNKIVVRELAEKYWGGEITQNSNKVEYLFEGKAELVEIIK